MKKTKDSIIKAWEALESGNKSQWFSAIATSAALIFTMFSTLWFKMDESKYRRSMVAFQSVKEAGDRQIKFIEEHFTDDVLYIFNNYNNYNRKSHDKLARLLYKFGILDEGFQTSIKLNQELITHEDVKKIFKNYLISYEKILKKEDLLTICNELNNTFIVIDEAYIEFSNQESMLKYFQQYDNLIITRTLSKFFGLAGIRLGFIFTKFFKDLLKVKSPYNVNILTCKIGINLFQNISQEIIYNRYLENLKNKELTLLWLEKFSEIDKIYSSDSNFLLIKSNYPGEDMANMILKKYNIKIKFFTDYMKMFCRISV